MPGVAVVLPVGGRGDLHDRRGHGVEVHVLSDDEGELGGAGHAVVRVGLAEEALRHLGRDVHVTRCAVMGEHLGGHGSHRAGLMRDDVAAGVEGVGHEVGPTQALAGAPLPTIVAAVLGLRHVDGAHLSHEALEVDPRVLAEGEEVQVVGRPLMLAADLHGVIGGEAVPLHDLVHDRLDVTGGDRR